MFKIISLMSLSNGFKNGKCFVLSGRAFQRAPGHQERVTDEWLHDIDQCPYLTIIFLPFKYDTLFVSYFNKKSKYPSKMLALCSTIHVLTTALWPIFRNSIIAPTIRNRVPLSHWHHSFGQRARLNYLVYREAQEWKWMTVLGEKMIYYSIVRVEFA